MAGKLIQAAGGIVVRNGARRLVAVVQRSKDDAWVLPRGKLKRGENPIAGARREVVEETGHRVRVHEFLGAITYRAQGRPKVVRFWRMQAEVKPTHEVMADIVAVEWLPLRAAMRRLSYPLERLFLRSVGSRALPRRKRRSRNKTAREKTAKRAAKKSAKKFGKKIDKTKKRRQSRAHKAASYSAKAKPHWRKRTAVRKSAPRYSAAKHAARSMTVPVAVKPAVAAERKTILQRMLDRLAG